MADFTLAARLGDFYGGYAMTNRTPTPLELGCASPTDPCIIDNFLSCDPPLKQIVGQTFELGFRGTNALSQFGLGPEWGKLKWSAGLFRTTLNNDILPVVSTFNGFGYYTNVGTTLRQGAEVGADGPAVGGRLTPTTPISTPSTSRPSRSRRRTIRWPTRTGTSRSPTARRSPAFQRIP